MARGRFIGKEISLDEKVAALSDDTARLLFTWTIAHLDREGRTYGEPHLIKAQVFPRQKISTIRIEKYLLEMEDMGIIIRYSSENAGQNHKISAESSNGVEKNRKLFQISRIKERYLSYPNFEKHQIGLRKDKESPSVIPPPPDKVTPPLLPTESRNKYGTRSGEVKVKDKEKLKIKISKEERLFQQYAFELDRLMLEFPEFDELTFGSHIKNCSRWWENSGKELKDPVKAARNWLIKERAALKSNPPGNMGRSSQLGIVPTAEELDKEEEF